MNAQRPAQPPLLTVMGVSGSGKTTVGAALAQRLRVPYADADDFHPRENIAKMAAGVPLDDADRLPWLDAIGAWLVDHTERGGVVSCSALKHSYRDVLRGATALVSASRDEGFGIPLVEAMGVGTPVVVSDIPVFREVGADAATYVPPGDVAGFVAAVRSLDDPTRWEEASTNARRRATHYSWTASARILLALLERVAAASPPLQ